MPSLSRPNKYLKFLATKPVASVLTHQFSTLSSLSTPSAAGTFRLPHPTLQLRRLGGARARRGLRGTRRTRVRGGRLQKGRTS